MSSIGGNPIKEESVDIKQINQDVKKMMDTTKDTMKKLRQTRAKLQGIKKTYEIISSDKYCKEIQEAFDQKLTVLENIAQKQEESIAILKSEKGISAKHRIKVKLDDMQRRADAAFQKDALVCKLTTLEIQLEKLEARKEELFKRINSIKGDKKYSFEGL